MTRTNSRLYQLLDGVTAWDEALQDHVEDWLVANCTRDQLVKIIDHAGYHYLVPISRPEPRKAALALEIVENLSPTELLTAWQYVIVSVVKPALLFRW